MVSAIYSAVTKSGRDWIGLEVRDVGLQVFTLYFTDEKTALTLILTNRDSL